jgi:acyl-CoA dehydrogenase
MSRNETFSTDIEAALALGEGYRDLRQSVPRICQSFPRERGLDEWSAYPTELVDAGTRSEFLAALIPEEYGRAGLPPRTAAAILEDVNASGCTASPAHAQTCIMGILLRHGSDEQKKKRYLHRIPSGVLRLQASGVTEPTTATSSTDRRSGRGARFITLMLLLAQTTPAEQVAKRAEDLSVFLVDLNEDKGNGVEIRPIKAFINHNTTELFIDNLKVPARNLIGEAGKVFRCILDVVNAECRLVASECVGDGSWLLKKGVDYANARRVFGRLIGQNQAVQFALARTYAELEAADTICRRAAALFNAHKPSGADAIIAKLFASEATWKAAHTTLQTFGGFGFAGNTTSSASGARRIYQTAPISTNLMLAYVAQQVLGLPRTY